MSIGHALGFCYRVLSIRRSVVAMLVLVGASGGAWSQTRNGDLFLVAASPYGRAGFGDLYESELYAVQPSGITMVRRIAEAREGIEFVVPDYASGLIAVGKPGGRPTTLDIISMQDPFQQITRPLDLTTLPDSAWRPFSSTTGTAPRRRSTSPPTVTRRGLVTRGAGSSWLVLNLALDGSALVAYPLAGTSSAQREVINLSDRTHPIVHGEFGFPYHGLGDEDTLSATFDSGRWTLRRGTESATVALPPIQELAGATTFWTILAHNEAATVVKLGPRQKNEELTRAPGFAQTRIYRARTGRWKPFFIAGSNPIVRCIGTWILAITGEEPRGRANPGAANRRKYPFSRQAPPRPDVEFRFRLQEIHYPGILVLLDTSTGTTVTIRTNEADSEPLLVDGSTVYYRVNDQILKAEIRGNGVGAPVLLGRADELRDVHWAFVSR